MKAQTAAICVIVKDEASDIAEWLIHHRMIGFDQLIVYDNESVDGTSELVQELAAMLPLDYVRWPSNGLSHPQMAAYEDSVKRWSGRVDWIAFIDSDEFLIPPRLDSKVQDLLERHEKHSAFALNWVLFGSSGLPDTHGRLIMESFLRRGPVHFERNDHVKIFVRPPKVLRCLTPHVLETEEPCFDLDGGRITWVQPERPGRSTKIVLGDWRLHHYFVRSHAHWRKRMLRGQRGMGIVRFRHELEEHDRNEEFDNTALKHAARVRSFMEAKGLEIGRPLTIGAVANVRCVLDVVNDGYFRGWAVDGDTGLAPSLLLSIDGEEVAILKPSGHRPDVVQAGLATTPRTGFQYAVPSRFRDAKPHRLGLSDHTGALIYLTRGAVDHTWIEFKARPVTGKICEKIDARLSSDEN